MRAAAITFAAGLRDGRPIRMAKRLTARNGRITDVEPARQTGRFRFREVEAPDLVTLMRAVWRAAQAGEIAVRGQPKAPEGRRAIHDDPEKGPAGLVVVPRTWCAFDWDGLEAEGDPLRDADAGVRLALRILPPAFREVSCGWQLSASAGFKPGFRLRTWHMLNHPTTGGELKGWCRPAIERCLLDPVTLVEAQPHYIAVDVTGGPDLCQQRFGIFRQGKDVVAVPDLSGMLRAREQRERAERLARYGPAPDRQRDPDGARSYAGCRIAECAETVRCAPDGTKHPTYVAECARARAIADRYGLDWPPIAAELRRTYEDTLPAREVERRRRGSIEGVLRWIEGRASG
jgi:hypothetical protein